ncbi:MAG: hypothetical protein H6R10_590 [Rhodocyclaceae bacterium]|nr:hypothetical protein [Rhodocyclaceae bacterium]
MAEAFEKLGGVVFFLDAVAQAEGKGEGYVSQAAREEAAQAAKNVAPAMEAAAAAAIGWMLEKRLEGVMLDPNDPFSDASLSGALSQILGVPVASVRDREALKDALKRAVTLRLSQETGVQFRDVFDRALLRQDVVRAIGARSSQVVPGLELRDLSDRATTTEDVGIYAARVVSDFTGINFQNLRSAQQIKEDVYAWAMPILRDQIYDGAEDGAGDYKRPLKMSKKAVRNREAQRRFRAKWGIREKYERL